MVVILQQRNSIVSFLCCSGIQEEKLILSVKQTADVKPVKEEHQEEDQLVVEISQVELSPVQPKKAELEKEEEVQEEEEVVVKGPKMNILKILTDSAVTQLPVNLYDHLKGEPEALTMLAPAAGDTIVSLDFSCPG